MDYRNGKKRFIMVLQKGWEGICFKIGRMTFRYEYFTTQEESQTKSLFLLDRI